MKMVLHCKFKLKFLQGSYKTFKLSSEMNDIGFFDTVWFCILLTGQSMKKQSMKALLRLESKIFDEKDLWMHSNFKSWTRWLIGSRYTKTSIEPENLSFRISCMICNLIFFKKFSETSKALWIYKLLYQALKKEMVAKCEYFSLKKLWILELPMHNLHYFHNFSYGHLATSSLSIVLRFVSFNRTFN